MMAKTTPQPLPLRSTTVVVGRSTTCSVTRSSAMLLSSRWTHLSGAESDSHAKRIWLPERKKGAAQAAPLSSVRMISVADLRYGRGPDAACQIPFVLVCFLARSEEHTSELQSLMRISY